MKNLTFLYTVFGAHKQFVLPFIWFANKYNPLSRFEIHFVNDTITNNLKNGLDILKDSGIDVAFIEDKSSLYTSMNYRWILEPKEKTPYTYIGDIDIMICEDICPFHINKMKEEKTIIDNVLRNNKKQMSGLQFVSTNEYYGATKKSRSLKRNREAILDNENFLLNILKESKIKIPSHDIRPIHGQHVSLNRRPFKMNSSMPNVIYDEFKSEFLETINEDTFKKLLDFSFGFKNTLNKYLSYCACKKMGNLPWMKNSTKIS